MSVFTGPDGKDETIIRLVGNVEPMPMGVIRMEPRKTDVGLLRANRENQVQLVLENAGDAALTISRIISTKSNAVYFSAENSDPIILGSGEKSTVKFSIKPDQPGRFLDTILIYSDARNDIGKGYKGLLVGEVK